jgi:hypothetical protein
VAEDRALTLAVAGLAGMMLAEVPQILSGFLPSPSTAYDKAAGAIDTGPESMAVLRRSEIKGSAVTVVMAGAVSAMASIVIGRKAWWLFGGAMGILALFLHDFESARKAGERARTGGTLSGSNTPTWTRGG